MFRELRISTAFLVLGCSSSVELSAPPRLTASSDPTVLAVVNEQVTAIAVDDQRLYWLGSVDRLGALNSGNLQSCEKQNCVSTLVTYGAAGKASLRWIGLSGGQVYWFEITEAGGEIVRALNACDVSGCEHGVRRVASNLANMEAAAFGSDYAYVVASYGMLRIPLTGNDAQPEPLFATDVLAVSAIAVQGDYLYWLGSREYSNVDSTVQRTRVDRSGEIETVADHLGITLDGSSLALDETHVYWSDHVLSGGIFRCPLAGCSGAPEPFVGPVRLPTTVLPDGLNLYWEQDTTESGGVISSCALTACAPSGPVARGVDDYAALAVDDEYLYTATTDQKLDPYVDWTNPSASIRRIRK